MTDAAQRPSAAVRTVTEVLKTPEGPEGIPLWLHPEWAELFPWLVQGTTGRDGPGDTTGFGLWGSTPVGVSLSRWRRLRETTGLPTAIHSRQVHGVRVEEWPKGLPSGLVVSEGADGHITRQPGMLLTVSAADCVPVFLVAENSRIVAVAHAGWRGVAGGMVENALAAMLAHDARLEEVRVHCGPSICGRCYEVGPEVHQAIHLSGGPFVKAPIDLRAAIAIRFVDAGVRPERITLSSHCTYCGGDFFSHRRGSEGRQVGVLGVRE